MRLVGDEKSSSSEADAAPVCPKCQRPKATPRDVIRWLSGADGYESVCFQGADYSRLLPDEEEVLGADLLKKRLIGVRRAKDGYACLVVAGAVRR